jgi:hypothetical protein
MKLKSVFTCITLLAGVLGGPIPTAASADELPSVVAPVLGASIRSDASYLVPVYNYDQAFTWSFRPLGVSRNIRVDIFDCHPAITVTVPCVGVSDLLNGETVTVEVTVTRSGYSPSTFNITGTSLGDGEDIQLGNYVRTTDGFTVENLRPNNSFAWSISVDHGSISFGPNNTLVVTGLTAGQHALVRIVSTNPLTYQSGRGFDGQALDSVSAAVPAPVPAPEPLAPAPAPATPAPSPIVEPVPAPSQEPAPLATPAPAPAEIPVTSAQKVEPTVTLGVSPLGVAQLNALTIPQLQALKPQVIGALAPNVLASLPVSKLRRLTRAQTRAMLHIQWLKLSPQQRKALRW